jgi:hypothetical protein
LGIVLAGVDLALVFLAAALVAAGFLAPSPAVAPLFPADFRFFPPPFVGLAASRVGSAVPGSPVIGSSPALASVVKNPNASSSSSSRFSPSLFHPMLIEPDWFAAAAAFRSSLILTPPVSTKKKEQD